MRAMASRSPPRAAHMLFPRRLRGVTDPMSGFFLVRRDALDLDALRPHGFKILLEILVRTPGLRAAEVPFELRRAARRREQGVVRARGCATCAALAPRLGGCRALRPLRGRGALRPGGEHAAARGAHRRVGLCYVLGAVLATQGSTLWNFCLTETWVFYGPRPHASSRGARAWRCSSLMNNAALALRGPLLCVLTSASGSTTWSRT